MALRLLCTLVVRPHDVPLPRNQLLLFYRVLHQALVGQDQVLRLLPIPYFYLFFLLEDDKKRNVFTGCDQHRHQVLWSSLLFPTASWLLFVDVGFSSRSEHNKFFQRT